MVALNFDDIARLPAPDDNIAIATRRLDAGTEIQYGAKNFTLSHSILVGHRFAIQPVAIGAALRSWTQTFGIATKPISVGDYVANPTVLKELRRRSLDITLPDEPNFQDDLEVYRFDEGNFKPADPLPRYEEMRTFMGYPRTGGRGVGTRNTIVVIGTSSLTAGFVRKLESRLEHATDNYPHVDGIAAVAHTEGGHGHSNNRDLLLRALAGFIVHPNVGAVLIVDYGSEDINNTVLLEYLNENNYALDHVTHAFMSLSHSFDDDIARAEGIISAWLDPVNQTERNPQPLSELKIALQCGGSDAFSGVSGNPLAAWVAKEVIQYGGSANLAETDELIGAETYVLDKVRDSATAKKFLATIERFKERVAWHGHSALSNPSGGNKYRGLYNIYLKSLGAAAKRHPDVRLDYVIDYGEPMKDSGYYFMDSPGNDLESVAGQVASGCNMIFFVTGNGSITNFPFVPTIKIVTTSERFKLLEADMDINAGLYLDGTPLEDVGANTLNYTIDVASGQLSVGEKAGHRQVQIWRDWQLTHTVDLEPLQKSDFSGEALPINSNISIPDVSIPVFQNGDLQSTDRVGLILPTSLCSGQIARMCVQALNNHPMLENSSVSRFVTLVHTEGCASVNLDYNDIMLGYLEHPYVKHALLLEHGCEITHNDYFHHALRERGHSPDDYGWASIQLDGGIHSVMQKMTTWFEEQLANDTDSATMNADLGAVRLGIVTQANPSAQVIEALTNITQMIVASGGTVILNEHDHLLQSDYAQSLSIADRIFPSLNNAQVAEQSGFHIMAMPTRDWGETLTGLGAGGVELFLSVVEKPMPGHPMIPMLQVGASQQGQIDIALNDSSDATQAILNGIINTLRHDYTPHVVKTGNVNFQVTRGLLGVSM